VTVVTWHKWSWRIFATLVGNTYGFSHTYTSLETPVNKNDRHFSNRQHINAAVISHQFPNALTIVKQRKRKRHYPWKGKQMNAFFFSGIRTQDITLETMVKTWDKIKVDFTQDSVKMWTRFSCLSLGSRSVCMWIGQQTFSVHKKEEIFIKLS